MLILVILSHITFMHNVVHDYVVCYGNDGHIQVENVDDCGSCDTHSIFDIEEISTSQFSSKNCEDVSLGINCFEEEQYISQNKISINRTILQSEMHLFKIEDIENTSNQKNNSILKNKTLESYTTISLIL